jgi:hypothetical protein
MFSGYDKGFPTIRRRLFILLATFPVGFFTVIPAHAASYYVATSGSDSNPGTEAAPFKTIARGSKAMASGDTLYIRAGTYNEGMKHGTGGFRFTNGTKSAYTRYAAYQGDQVTLMPATLGLVYAAQTVSHIEISGFIIDGSKGSGGGVVLLGSNIRLLKNEIRFTKGVAIGAVGGNEIIGNKVHGAETYGIYSGGDKGLMEGNVFYNNGGYGIHLYNYSNPVNGWVIRNNVVHSNGKGFQHSSGGWQETSGVIITRGKANQFSNNIVYNNHKGGVRVAFRASDTLIANNTIYGNNEYGIDISNAFGGSDGARVINNISYGNKGAQIKDTGTNTTFENNLTIDPKFVNVGGGDFGLQAGSPAIDKGLALAAVPDDFTGKKRPEGAAYYIGAFEGAGSKANVLPGVGAGLPGGDFPSGGAPVLRGPDGQICPTGF